MYNKLIIKTIHQVVNISTTKAKLFAIHCGINQAINVPNIRYIVIITDSLHTAKRIFDSLTYPYQIYSAAISHKLWEFFSKNVNNCIEFWDCPSKQKWPLYFSVDKETRNFNLTPIFPCKLSWNYCKKHECESVIAQWKMMFQTLDFKGRNFLELLNNGLNPFELSALKGGSWLQYFSYSNPLYTRATRAIVNYAPIGEYQLRFFLREDFSCPCGIYPIESR